MTDQHGNELKRRLDYVKGEQARLLKRLHKMRGTSARRERLARFIGCLEFARLQIQSELEERE